MGCPENGIIFGTAMAEKRRENSKVRYSAAYPTGAARSVKGHFTMGADPIVFEMVGGGKKSTMEV